MYVSILIPDVVSFFINMYNSILTIERRKIVIYEEQGKIMMVERVECIAMATKAQWFCGDDHHYIKTFSISVLILFLPLSNYFNSSIAA